MTVFMVRHGEVDNPDRLVYADMPGFGLSDRGRQEAKAAAQFLAPLGLAAIHASPLQRAQETAAAISAACGVEVSTRDDLTEWLVARRWKGVAWEDLHSAFPGELEAYLEHPTDLPFAAESIEQLGERVAAAVAQLAARHLDEAIAVVSHQDPIQAGRLKLRGLPLEELHLDRPGHCDVLTLEPGEPWHEVGYWVPQLEGPPPPAWPPVNSGDA